MIRTIQNFTPPPDASPYNPAKTVTVPAGDSAEVELQGRDANTFGMDRILIGGSSLNEINVSARLNDELIVLEDVQASAIQQHFKQNSLLAPFVIQRNNNLRFTLENPTAGDITVNIELLGYDAPSLAKLIQEYKDKGWKIPQPIFLYAQKELTAQQADIPVPVKTKSVDVDLVRATVSTDSDSDIRVSMQVYNETIKNKVFVEQLNAEFEDNYARVPIRIGKNVPFQLSADNDNAAGQTLSFLGEAYVYQQSQN